MPEEQLSEEDQELLVQLKRVGSDLGFRASVRKYIKWIVIFLIFNLAISCIAIYAFVKVRTIQKDNCDRANDFREAYVHQWKPVLADSPPASPPADDAPQEVKDAYNRQQQLRTNFENSLDTDFAPLEC